MVAVIKKKLFLQLLKTTRKTIQDYCNGEEGLNSILNTGTVGI